MNVDMTINETNETNEITEIKPKKRGRKVGSKNKVKSENSEEILKPKKKRGRKPKESIISNENATFATENNNNLIIRINKNKNDSDDIKSYDNENNYSTIDTIEKGHNIICWNCCHSLKTTYGIPLKYQDNIFYIYGYFCSLECGSRYAFDNFSNGSEIYTLINHYYNIINDTISEKINIPSNKLILDIFGGDQNIDEYRKNFKTTNLYDIIIPPIFPINHKINKYEENINIQKSELKLYRKKKLVNEDTNISSSMKLNIT